MKKLLFTITILAFSTPAMADNHGDDEGASAPDMAVISCESDADCEEYKMLCVDGYCDLDWTPPPSCESDAECADTEHCVWGSCHEQGMYCQTDDDCGDYMMCRMGGMGSSGASGGSMDTPTPLPTDPDGEGSGEGGEPDGSGAPERVPMPVSCESDADCGDEVCIDGFCQWQDEGDGEPAEEWGRCTLDPEQVPTDEACAALCEAVGSCAGEGDTVVSTDDAAGSSGNADGTNTAPTCEDDTECVNEGEFCIDGACQREEGGEHFGPSAEEQIGMCTAMCSYAVLNEVALDELATLSQCVIDNADAEDPCAVLDLCDEAGEAWGDAIMESDIADDVGFGMGGGLDVGEGGEGTRNTGDGGTSGAPVTDDGGDGEGSGGTAPPSDSGGCGATDAPTIPWLVLMTLGLAALLRRRQTA
jgi:uncharacterized protein (TIGR03382 family)